MRAISDFTDHQNNINKGRGKSLQITLNYTFSGMIHVFQSLLSIRWASHLTWSKEFSAVWNRTWGYDTACSFCQIQVSSEASSSNLFVATFLAPLLTIFCTRTRKHCIDTIFAVSSQSYWITFLPNYAQGWNENESHIDCSSCRASTGL